MHCEYCYASAEVTDLLQLAKMNECNTNCAIILLRGHTLQSCCDVYLKPGKSDGSLLSWNHFINASSALVSVLSPLFTALVQHAFLPGDLKNCVFKPIPIPFKDPASSDSYRPIALAPILSKVLEWCILLQFSEYFVTSPLQFGFKKSMSTTLCSGLVKNIVSHYMAW